jgi:ribonuclease BN (tRNA processing enzyme)
MIEAISEGGLKPQGILLAPGDCYDKDPVVLEYNRNYLSKVIRIHEGFKLELNGVSFEFPIRHKHGVETYGYIVSNNKFKLAHIIDTQYFEELIPGYRDVDVLIMNMVFSEPRPFPHLSYDDVIKLLNGIKPKLAIVTHFGYNLWKLDVEKYAKKIQKVTGIATIAASDAMQLDMENREIIS